MTLADLRAHAIARSLFAPTTLPKAIAHLRTAITFEPKNVSFRQKLDRLEQQLKAAKSASK